MENRGIWRIEEGASCAGAAPELRRSCAGAAPCAGAARVALSCQRVAPVMSNLQNEGIWTIQEGARKAGRIWRKENMAAAAHGCGRRLVTGSCVIRETTPTGCPRSSRAFLSLSIYPLPVSVFNVKEQVHQQQHTLELKANFPLSPHTSA